MTIANIKQSLNPYDKTLYGSFYERPETWTAFCIYANKKGVRCKSTVAEHLTMCDTHKDWHIRREERFKRFQQREEEKGLAVVRWLEN
jgi:hypothetical protein